MTGDPLDGKLDAARVPWIFLSLGYFALLVVVLLASLPLPFSYNYRDEILDLSGAYRVLKGQVPHNDFQSTLGMFAYLILALPAKFFGITANLFVYAKIIVLVFVFFLSWFLSITRMSRWESCLLTIFLGSMIFLPRYMKIGDIGHAFLYHRIGYPFLSLIIIESLIRPLRGGKYYELLSGLFSGILLFMLILIKPTLFLIGLFSILLGYFILERCLYRSFGLLLGLLFGFLIFSLYLDFRFTPFIRDFLLASDLRNGDVSNIIFRAFRRRTFIEQYVLIFFIGYLLIRTPNSFRISSRYTFSNALVFIFLLFSEIFL
ncbi:MAG: hypothetical protein D6732_03360, partial [Methanobacteriota archaeon]